MVSRILLTTCLLFLPGGLWAAPPAVPDVKTGIGIPTVVRASAVVDRWVPLTPGLHVLAPGLLVDKNTAVVSSAAPGSYELLALVGKEGTVCLVKVEAVGPQPPPPVPDPFPPPPPPPPPPPSPSVPIPHAGFRVLMVYETGETSKLPQAQIAILTAKEIRDYLKAKTVIGPDGKTREFRIWDKDLNVAGDHAIWREAMKRQEQGANPLTNDLTGKRTTLPWIMISDGTRGFEGPLPKTVEETLALLKQYGGQ